MMIKKQQKTLFKSFLQNIIDTAKQHWFMTIIIISVVIMLAVHILYKFHPACDFFVAEWSAGDLLMFYGSIIGAMATIYVLQETIRSTINQQNEDRIYLENQQREDKAFSLKPYFIITAQEAKWIGENREDIFSLNSSENWDGDTDILITIENVGAGNAVDVYAVLSQKNNEEISDPIPALIVGKKQFILVKRCFSQTLEFEIRYSDIANIAAYTARTSISIIRGGSNIGIKNKSVFIERHDDSK